MPPWKKYTPLDRRIVSWDVAERGGRLTYMLAAPLPPAPRHPMRSMDNGVSESKKPARPLHRRRQRLGERLVWAGRLGRTWGSGFQRSCAARP